MRASRPLSNREGLAVGLLMFVIILAVVALSGSGSLWWLLAASMIAGLVAPLVVLAARSWRGRPHRP